MLKFHITFLILVFTAGCASFEPTKGKKPNAYYRLNDFKIIFDKCINCSQLLAYKAENKINSLIQNHSRHKQYTAKVQVEFLRKAISTRSDSVSMRDKILLKIKYDIIDNRQQEIVLTDQILQIDTRPLSKSTFTDFISEEKLSIQSLDEAINDLKHKLLVFTLEQDKQS